MENKELEEKMMRKLDDLIEKSNKILGDLEKLRGEPDVLNLPKENRMQINDDEFFKEDGIDYDPDSSSIAWLYYEKMYNEKIVIDINACKDTPSNKYYRRIGTFSYNLTKGRLEIIQLPKEPTLEKGIIKIAGDCTFNFGDSKRESFLKVISKINDENIKKKLNLCSKMHHSPYNFSLIPRTGGMGNRKQNGGDRPDWLLFSLREFYKNRDRHPILECCPECERMWIRKIQNEGERIITQDDKNAYEKNTEICLADFLLKINSVEEYCRIFYHFEKKDVLYYLMMGLGGEQIKDIDGLNMYMDLAIKYWIHQRSHYENVTKNKEEK